MRVLALKDVDVWLGGRHILRSVDFSIDDGEFTGLIGSNGAGKTTILRVIMGLQAATAGTVLVEGQPLKGRNRSIGYVPQKVLIDADVPMRARDLVELGIDGQRFGLRKPSKDRRARVDEILEAVDASGFADARIGSLSGGQQQRILIAHALAGNPRLLLLDEPLANLDITSAHEIVELLARVVKDQGVSVLMSAHDMNPLLPVMDKVVYVADGKAASGATGEVVRTEVLSELYGSPVSVLDVNGRVLVIVDAEGFADHHIDSPGHH